LSGSAGSRFLRPVWLDRQFYLAHGNYWPVR
jgi:hypothetical protein